MGKLNMKLAAKINAANTAAYVAMVAFFPQVMQEYFGHMGSMDLNSPTAKLMTHLNLSIYIVGTVLMYAVSKMSTEGAVKRCLQYSLGGWMLLLGVLVWQGRDYLTPMGLYVKAGWMFFSICFNIYVIYGTPGKKVNAVEPYTDSEPSYTMCLRVEYVQILLWGLTYLLCPWLAEDVGLKGLPEGPDGTFFICMRGAVLCGFALLYMAAAQADERSQKKLLEFGMLRRFVILFHVLCINSSSILGGADGLNKLYGMIAYEVLNLTYLISVLYPAGYRRWFCRALYSTYIYIGFLNILYPSLCATLFQNVVYSEQNSYLVGLHQIIIALAFIAVAQTDSDSQGVFIQYGALGHLLFIVLEGFADMKGGLLAYISFAFLVASIFDMYLEKYPAAEGSSPMRAASPKRSPMKMKSMSSMKKRGRSKTPGRK
jgi:hypothetical protein